MKLTRCALCRATNIIHIGEPPGTGGNSRNRCTHRGFTGTRGKRGRGYIDLTRPGSWRWPVRGSKMCRFPLTTPAGERFPELSWSVYAAFTRQDFDVRALEALVRRSAAESLDKPPDASHQLALLEA